MARSCALWLAPLLALAGCTAAPLELSVDVRTDLRPGEEADTATVEIVTGDGDVVGPTAVAVVAGEAWAAGRRVGDFRGLSAGETRVRATLERDGVVVLAREVRFTLTSDFALTVSLDRACLDVACDGDASECANGRCVPPACGSGDPAPCGAIACAADADCVALPGCAVAHCQHALCVCDQRGDPDAGAIDATVPPLDAGCECVADEEETRPCGACEEGVERRTRTCDGCAFGTWSEWGACETSAECAPGATDEESRPCGNCDLGTQRRTRSCDDTTCTWGAWGSYSTCTGGGTCAPGATRTGCDPCGHEVCSTSCTWGACTLRSGSQCLRIRPGTSGPPGNNWRCCGADQWQFCMSTCQWSTDCDPCSGCSC